MKPKVVKRRKRQTTKRVRKGVRKSTRNRRDELRQRADELFSFTIYSKKSSRPDITARRSPPGNARVSNSDSDVGSGEESVSQQTSPRSSTSSVDSYVNPHLTQLRTQRVPNIELMAVTPVTSPVSQPNTSTAALLSDLKSRLQFLEIAETKNDNVDMEAEASTSGVASSSMRTNSFDLRMSGEEADSDDQWEDVNESSSKATTWHRTRRTRRYIRPLLMVTEGSSSANIYKRKIQQTDPHNLEDFAPQSCKKKKMDRGHSKIRRRRWQQGFKRERECESETESS